MHKLKISIPVYDFEFTVLIEDDITPVIEKYMKKHGMPPVVAGDEYHGLAIMTPAKKFFLFYDLQSITPGIITHEISHMVDYLVEEKGLEKTGESRAHITEHLSEKIFNYALKHNILISKHLDYKQKLKPASMPEPDPKEGTANP